MKRNEKEPEFIQAPTDKETKKAAKPARYNPGAKKKAIKAIKGIVAAIVVVALLFVSLDFIGVSRRVVNAVTIDGKSYSMSELSCYYMQVYNYYNYYSSYYDSNYGDGYGKMIIGYDTTLSPTAQSTQDDDGNTVTWDEFFLTTAIHNMADTKRYYAKAIDEGTELAEADLEEIQSTLDNYASSAGNYSLSRYISKIYGKGVSTGLLEKVLTEQKYVSVYQENRQEALGNEFTADQVNEEYNKDKTAYDVVSFRWYQITVEAEEEASTSASAEDTTDTEAEPIAEELDAQRIIDSISAQSNFNEETFKQAVLDYMGADDENYATYRDQDGATLLQKISKATIDENISEDAGNWLFAQNDNGDYTRQAGDMSYFLTDDGASVYVLYAIGTPYQDDTVPASVRHILVQFPEEESTTEETATEESTDTETSTATETTTVAETTTIAAAVKAECSSEAESIKEEYESYIEENVSGEADENYFAELVSKHSDDTASVSDGGLISDMKNDGSYVKQFEDWAFAEGDFEGQTRTEGDVEVIETEYGYHVMYYVGGHEHPTWYETIETAHIDEAWTKEQEDFEASFSEDAITRKSRIEAWVKNSCIKMIDANNQAT